jgi:hypothetical protein
LSFSPADVIGPPDRAGVRFAVRLGGTPERTGTAGPSSLERAASNGSAMCFAMSNADKSPDPQR